MIHLKKISSLLFLASSISMVAHVAHADEFCENWAAYMWDFDKQYETSPDSTWSELNAMSHRLSKNRRIAGTGTVSKSEAIPFPSIPSAIETELDVQTQSKVRGLYEKYVLLGRRIDDSWKDKFKNTESPTSMQRFAAERDSLVFEMNKIARTAKAEFERYGLRTRDCFTDYEQFAKKQVQNLNQALASASSSLKVDDGVWAHAYDATPGAVSVPAQDSVPQVSARRPASATEPAIVSDPVESQTGNQ